MNLPFSLRLIRFGIPALLFAVCEPDVLAEVPKLLNHQGRIAVSGVNFEGAGLFKFALTGPGGTTTYWSNDGTGAAGAEPVNAVTLPVTRGLYSVLLGDASLPNMTALPAEVFENGDVRLRVWFSDSVNGFQQIIPDQRLAAAPYALAAESAVTARTFTGTLGGEITGGAGATSIAAATVTGKALTGLVSGPGAVHSSDSILGAIGKLDGNLALKANIASPVFTGTVVLPAGTSSAAPLRLPAGGKLTTPVFGSMEFDGNNLYLTTGGAAGPARKTLAFTDASSASVALSSITAAPVKPVIAWGKNDSGQTVAPNGLAGVAGIAAGESHSLALLDSGMVVAWGSSASGQTAVPGDLVGVTEIAAGAAHSLARRNDGTLAAWGDNSLGQTALPPGITTAAKVAAGGNHSLALLADGTVRAWGDSTFTQTAIPPGLAGVTAIAAGSDHSLALRSDGTIAAWGRNETGQTQIPPDLGAVTAIAAGAFHSLALKADGTVAAWGWNAAEQCTVPPGLTGVIQIAGGYTFSMALKADGTVVVWGDSSAAQTVIPVSATAVTRIAAGAYHILALRADAVPALVARLDQDNVLTGRLGIKRTAAANTLEVEGTASKSTAGGWLANSDRRIKTDIEPITGALEKLSKVRLVDFRYTEDYRTAHPGVGDRRYLNVVAQEFAEVFPDDVKSSGEKMPDGSPVLQVDTYPLTIYTAAGLQELQRAHDELKEKNILLQRQVRNQEERLRRLETLLPK